MKAFIIILVILIVAFLLFYFLYWKKRTTTTATGTGTNTTGTQTANRTESGVSTTDPTSTDGVIQTNFKYKVSSDSVVLPDGLNYVVFIAPSSETYFKKVGTDAVAEINRLLSQGNIVSYFTAAGMAIAGVGKG